jgi:hypothetical protein
VAKRVREERIESQEEIIHGENHSGTFNDFGNEEIISQS